MVDKFKHMASRPYNFSDQQRFEELVAQGAQLLREDDIDRLRQVVGNLYQIRINAGSDSQMFDEANIIRG